MFDPDQIRERMTRAWQSADVPHHSLRITRGCYLQDDPDWEWWDRDRAIHTAQLLDALDQAPDATACLTSAAVAWGLVLWSRPRCVDIHRPRAHSHPSTDLPPLPGDAAPSRLVRHTYALREEDITSTRGVPVTTLERLAVDAACRWHPRDALVLGDAILGRLVEPDRRDRRSTERRAGAAVARMEAILDRVASRRGTARARAILQAMSPWSESPGESSLRWAILALGLPAPSEQLPVARDASRFFYLDGAWEDLGVGYEFDGAVKYGGAEGPAAVVAEKKRDEEVFRLTGIRLHHVSRSEIDPPARAAGTLRAILPGAMWRERQPRRGLWHPDLRVIEAQPGWAPTVRTPHPALGV